MTDLAHPSTQSGPFRCKAIRPVPDHVPADRILTRPPLEVVAGVLVRQGLYLIAQRKPEDRLGGTWEFPGGKVDPGETLEGALAREWQEELGVEVEVGEEIHRTEHAYPDLDIRLTFFHVRLRAGEPQPLEAAAVRWVAPAELAQYQFPEADRPLLEMLHVLP